MRRLSTTSALGAATLLYLTGCAAPHKARVGAENPVVRLQRDMTKVERAIEATKRLLALAHSAPYVPDLYLRLAELYAEQSRYQYLIAYESDKRRSKAVVSIPALRSQATLRSRSEPQRTAVRSVSPSDAPSAAIHSPAPELPPRWRPEGT